MSELPTSNGLLIVPHLRVQNANAISSPLTWGFPAISAFIGLMQAVERKLEGRFALMFDSVGVVCHSHDAQVTGGYQRAFRLTRNPVNERGETAAIVEEGRIHLDITLIFGVSGYSEDGQPDPVQGDWQQRQQIARDIADLLGSMRIAGGSVFLDPQKSLHCCPWPKARNVASSSATCAAAGCRALPWSVATTCCRPTCNICVTTTPAPTCSTPGSTSRA